MEYYPVNKKEQTTDTCINMDNFKLINMYKKPDSKNGMMSSIYFLEKAKSWGQGIDQWLLESG